jgi:hypothetical protein
MSTVKKFGLKKSTQLRDASQISKEELDEIKSINYFENNVEINNDSSKINDNSNEDTKSESFNDIVDKDQKEG